MAEMESPPAVEERKRQPSSRSQRGLDWFAFFLADIQTGWGPFVAAYLTSKNWTQLDIGLILTVGTLAAMVMQIPIGALVDQVPAKRLLAGLAVVAISGSALLLAFWPVFSVVLGAKLLHAMASCLAGPVLASISLGLVGHSLLSRRLGRNARFLSLGNAIAAGLMGGVAYYYSNQAIFFLTAALAIPTLLALAQIRSADIDPDLARGGLRKGEGVKWSAGIAGLASNRAFLIFAAAIVLFQLSNAAMLPIMAGNLDEPRAGMGHRGDRDLHSSAAIRGRSHRPVGRTHGAKLGPPSSPDVVFRATMRAWCGLRGLERSRCGRSGTAAGWNFGGDPRGAYAARHRRHHARDRAFQLCARRGRRRYRHRRFPEHHACRLCCGHVWRRRDVFVSRLRRRLRSSAGAGAHARNARSQVNRRSAAALQGQLKSPAAAPAAPWRALPLHPAAGCCPTISRHSGGQCCRRTAPRPARAAADS